MAPLKPGPNPRPPFYVDDRGQKIDKDTPYKYDEAPPEYATHTGKYGDCEGRTIEESGGMKNDNDKPDWSLLPLETIEGIVEVLTYGAKKYKRDNWKKVSVNRNFAALLRHLSKWQAGEEFDAESGLHHLDHALCDLMFIVYNLKAR